MTHPRRYLSLILFGSAMLGACSSQPQQTGTLGDLDVAGGTSAKPAAEAPPKNKEDIKRAYYDYLQSAAKDDQLRVTAATRVAELELELGRQIEGQPASQVANDDAAFTRQVRATIELLNTTLRDFPNAPGNDHVLYQLAKAYDQVAESDQAVAALEKMVQLYPDTPYFIEAKFRIAEHAFVNGRYFDAEDAYTDVIQTKDNSTFMERALFKRGWARYKQELYQEALDDYFAALDRHSSAAALKAADQPLFEEYFRAVGLAFLYLDGADALKDYFSRHPHPGYLFTSYQAVAELQLKQEHYSDAAATYQAFSREYPQSPDAIHAGLAVIRIWKDKQFFEPYRQAFDEFYQRYEPDARFWKNPKIQVPDATKKLAIASIRDNIVLLAARDHAQYRKSKKPADFAAAQRWYESYLKDYSAYARQDKIHQLYAELLSQAGQLQQSLAFYEKAAFDGDIVLDKESAYAAVFLTDKLQQQAGDAQARKPWLDKHLTYAQLYAELYAAEKQTPLILQNATQLAFKAGLPQQVIAFANILPDTAPAQVREEVNLLKAQAYFDLQKYEEAELVYQDLLANPRLEKNSRVDLGNKLALSIYRQAEVAQRNRQVTEAARQFLRIEREIPDSELAPTAMYDAIALFMANELWNEAVDYLNRFQRLYPKHPLQPDASKKLSVAYLNSGRSLEAAREFEKLADFGADTQEKMAALWRAAELYQSKGDLPSAARAYTEYANAYKRPYTQNLEAMGQLAVIHGQLKDADKRQFWLREIIGADAKAPKSNKNERTEYLAASASFDLAQLRQQDFERVRLLHPLPKSLQNKKTTMQDAVKLYGQSAVYGHKEFVTRATLAIGDIYRIFAKSLLESERPKNLSADELEQYNILLEDQAFPFEDKAIEFYETNMSRIAAGTFDPAIKTSLERLKVLFPARYGRPGKVETSVARLGQ